MDDSGSVDELYDDLVAPDGHQGTLLQAELDALRAENSDQKQRLDASLQLQQSLAAEVEALRKENAVLATNISSLFRTAQLELERKNKEIAALRQATHP